MAVFDKMTTYPVHGFRKSEEFRCDVFSASKLYIFVLCALSKSFNGPKHVSLHSKSFSQNDEFDFYLMEVLCCVPKKYLWAIRVPGCLRCFVGLNQN
jgi:hypothetical protein